jgi:hypothetical protein
VLLSSGPRMTRASSAPRSASVSSAVSSVTA